nr:hypothetical protein [Tanacetum cinerariifolium]
AAADELSPISYLGPKAIPNFFRGGKVTFGLSSLRLAEGSCDGGGWEVEAASSLSTGAGMEILAVVRYAGCGGGVAADSSVSNG